MFSVLLLHPLPIPLISLPSSPQHFHCPCILTLSLLPPLSPPSTFIPPTPPPRSPTPLFPNHNHPHLLLLPSIPHTILFPHPNTTTMSSSPLYKPQPSPPQLHHKLFTLPSNSNFSSLPQPPSRPYTHLPHLYTYILQPPPASIIYHNHPNIPYQILPIPTTPTSSLPHHLTLTLPL